MYRIFGIPPDEFGASYATFLDALHPDDRDMVDHAYLSSLEEGGRYDVEYRILHKSDGQLRWGHARCEHDRDANGKAIRSYGTVQDITERKQNEQVLRESDERFRHAALFGRGEDLQIRIIRSTTVVFEKLIAADAVQSQTPVRGRAQAKET
jgi:PAS domain S-box-containing protein